MIPLGVLASSYVTPAGGGPSTLLDYVGSATLTATGTTFTFTDVPIGDEYIGREIIAVATGYYPGSTTLSAATIGGTPATLDEYAAWPGYIGAAIFRGTPTGAATTIAATFAATRSSCALFIFRTSQPVAVATHGGRNVAAVTVDRGLVAPSGSYVLVAGGGSLDQSMTWANCSGVATETLESAARVGVALGTGTGVSTGYGFSVPTSAQLQVRVAAYQPAT